MTAHNTAYAKAGFEHLNYLWFNFIYHLITPSIIIPAFALRRLCCAKWRYLRKIASKTHPIKNIPLVNTIDILPPSPATIIPAPLKNTPRIDHNILIPPILY
jgi:hypothetical protein